MRDDRAPPVTADGRPDRAQASLVALAVALVLLTSVTVLSLAVAEGALASADDRPLDRRAAAATVARLVADSETTRRPNVLDESAFEDLSAADVEALAPVVAGRPFRVRLGDETVVSRGDLDPETTVRRRVLVERRTERVRTASVGGNATLTVPRGSTRVEVAVHPANNTTVTTVRADDRVVLYDPGGLDGSAVVRVRSGTNTTLSTTATDTNGTLEATYATANATTTTLEVTVGAA